MTRSSRRIRLRVGTRDVLFVCLLALAGCAGFQPAPRAPEAAIPPADAALWHALAAAREDNWHRALSGGEDALDWRLRLIDSASSSIDLETFPVEAGRERRARVAAPAGGRRPRCARAHPAR